MAEMWTYAIDEASGSLCRVYDSILGRFPASCLVNAGRPALGLTLAVLAAIAICGLIAVNRTRT